MTGASGSDDRERVVASELQTALDRAESLPEPERTQIQLALKQFAQTPQDDDRLFELADAQGGQGAWIIIDFVVALVLRHDEEPVYAKPCSIAEPEPVESALQALQRQAEPELLNELLAGGAVAASFTAGAAVAKAKIEATTQRRKIDRDNETERLRIASEERIAWFQARGQNNEVDGQ